MASLKKYRPGVEGRAFIAWRTAAILALSVFLPIMLLYLFAVVFESFLIFPVIGPALALRAFVCFVVIAFFSTILKLGWFCIFCVFEFPIIVLFSLKTPILAFFKLGLFFLAVFKIVTVIFYHDPASHEATPRQVFTKNTKVS